MRKSAIPAGWLSVVFILSVGLGSIIYGGVRLYAQESEFYIDNASAHHSNSRPAVYFPHEIHMETYECLDCHHDYQSGENVLDEDDLEEDGNARCAACHLKSASIGLKSAYHRQCMGCHRLVNQQDGARLPITCGDCHPRKPAAP